MKTAGVSSYTGMVKIFRILIPALLLVSGVACKKSIATNEAVRKGVLAHLTNNKGLSVESMDVEITAVTFRDTEADATVSFKPKGGDAAAGMSMKYTLERKGSEWVVKKTPAAGGHGAVVPGGMGSGMGGGMGSGMGMPMPPNHPPAGSAPAPKK
jgi:hypothetical protein